VELSTDITNALTNDEPYSYFIIGAGQEQLLSDINAALAELYTEGIFAEISKQFFNEDFTPSAWYESVK
jgi:ABC-type amino acid transport substrate-binding protein